MTNTPIQGSQAETIIAEAQNDAIWARFYRDGADLGEIAREFGGGIYDYSPWLYAPLLRRKAPTLPEAEGIRGALAWIDYQANSAMAVASGASLTSGDPEGALEMLNSIASDISANVMMLADRLGLAAPVDGHPQGEDPSGASFMTSAVPEGEAP